MRCNNYHYFSIVLVPTLSIALPTFDTLLCISLCSLLSRVTTSFVLFKLGAKIRLWTAFTSVSGGAVRTKNKLKRNETKLEIEITIECQSILFIHLTEFARE